MSQDALVAVDKLKVHFPVQTSFLSREKPVVHALNGVSLEVADVDIDSLNVLTTIA